MGTERRYYVTLHVIDDDGRSIPLGSCWAPSVARDALGRILDTLILSAVVADAADPSEERFDRAEIARQLRRTVRLAWEYDLPLPDGLASALGSLGIEPGEL